MATCLSIILVFAACTSIVIADQKTTNKSATTTTKKSTNKPSALKTITEQPLPTLNAVADKSKKAMLKCKSGFQISVTAAKYSRADKADNKACPDTDVLQETQETCYGVGNCMLTFSDPKITDKACASRSLYVAYQCVKIQLVAARMKGMGLDD